MLRPVNEREQQVTQKAPLRIRVTSKPLAYKQSDHQRDMFKQAAAIASFSLLIVALSFLVRFLVAIKRSYCPQDIDTSAQVRDCRVASLISFKFGAVWLVANLTLALIMLLCSLILLYKCVFVTSKTVDICLVVEYVNHSTQKSVEHILQLNDSVAIRYENDSRPLNTFCSVKSLPQS